MPRLAHDDAAFRALRRPTSADPLRVLVSGCLAGWGCGIDGTHYGLGDLYPALFALPTIRVRPFCPEDHGMGTPRSMPDIHGGDGFDVVRGAARVLDEHGNDLTEKMLAGARAMLAHALEHAVELAILTDMSAACGSQVISDGCRLVPVRKFHASVGVATALLLEEGIAVIAQRDKRSMGRLRAWLDPSFTPDPTDVDYHETEWYRGQFGAPPPLVGLRKKINEAE
ncbi:MAG: DUF523 domain-containing protein [Polyangiaceae bacterium]